MSRTPAATVLGYQGMPVERLLPAQYVVLSPRVMVVVDSIDMMHETVRLLTIAGEVEITVFQRTIAIGAFDNQTPEDYSPSGQQEQHSRG